MDDTPAPRPFNPLDKVHLGESVTKALLRQPVSPLPPLQFIGAGIYAIYYVGQFPLYEEIARRNQRKQFRWPIYVGKADAQGRKGGFYDEDPESVGKKLYSRLSEHAESIVAAHNTLSLDDFSCRFLVVDDIWVPLAETLLIKNYQPVWNVIVEGFGNHAPGGKRSETRLPLWDMIHPGREWSKGMTNPKMSPTELEARVSEHIRAYLEKFNLGNSLQD
jgi:hypothetical protein